MKRTLALGLLISMTLLMTPASAKQSLAQGKYMNYGQGTGTCGSWIEDRKVSSNPRGLTWVTGFVSGAGWMGHRMRDTDADGMMSFVDQYCDSHRLDKVAEAAAALVQALEVKTP